jgi:hypothetical protein
LALILDPVQKADHRQNQTVPDQIAGQFSAQQMRTLGSSLLKLADALDDDWQPEMVRSKYHWVTGAGQIERNALPLAQVAMRLRRSAEYRTRHFSKEWFGEPAWNMLLELFIQFAGGARVSVKSLVIASGAPETTAGRMLNRLESHGLVERKPSATDRRVMPVSLTCQGVIRVGSALKVADC